MFDVILVTILLFEYGLSDDTICVPGGPNIGYTSPKGDLYLLPNGDLVVNCTLNKPEYDSADIFWKIATVETNASYVSVLDNRTAQLQLPHSQYPSNFFPATCWIRDRKGSVCHNIVHVGDLPASNITINCTSYDFKRIYCEWDLKKENEINSNWEFQHLNKYKCDEQVNSELVMYYCCQLRLQCNCHNFRTVTEECCNTTKKLMLNCSCEKDEFCHDWEQVFTLKGQNALGTGTTSYTFDQRRNVILSPPDGVNAIDIGNTSATILWDKSYDCTSHLINQTDSNMTIEINLTIKWNNKEQESKTLNFANETYLLTNLIPFSDYEVEIRRRVVVESFKNPYGPRKRVSFRTHPGVPTKSPENLIGSLSEDENTDTVNLTLYWKGIPKEFQGANKFKYIIYISFTGISGTMERRTTNTTTFFLSLSKNASYTFRVKGENEVGETNEESKYSLDSEADYGEDLNSLDVQDVIYDNETQKYIVSWKTSRNQTSSWFRLYWCLGNRTPDGTIFCNAAGINSKEIKGTNVTLSQPYNENCFFGVAAEKPSKFGGLQWSACVIPTNRSPTSPAVLKVLSKGTTWVHLTWKQLPCEEKFVGGYELRIIDIRNSSEIKTVIEGVDANKYNVTGLSPGSTYKFEIRSKTHKEVSEAIASERITTDTDDSGSNDTDEDETGHLVVWIVVPVVCIIVVVTGIAFCKYKSFRDQVKKIIIHVPPRLMEGHPATCPAVKQPLLQHERLQSLNLRHFSQPNRPEERTQETMSCSTTDLLSSTQFNVNMRGNLTSLTTVETEPIDQEIEKNLPLANGSDSPAIENKPSGYVQVAEAVSSCASTATSLTSLNLRDVSHAGGLTDNKGHDNEYDSEHQFGKSSQLADRYQKDYDCDGGYTKASENVKDYERYSAHLQPTTGYRSVFTAISDHVNSSSPNNQRSEGYMLASTAIEIPNSFQNNGYQVTSTNTASVVRNPEIASGQTVPQQNNRKCNTGYSIACTDVDDKDKLPSEGKRVQLDSSCSSGYKTKSSAMIKTIFSIPKHQQRNNPDYNAGCIETSAVEGAEVCPGQYNRKRIDSGCSVGYTSTSDALSKPISSISIQKQQNDPEVNTAYTLSHSVEGPYKPLSNDQERLGAGYTVASVAVNTPICSSSSVDQQEDNPARSVGYSLASIDIKGTEHHVNKFDPELVEYSCKVRYLSAARNTPIPATCSVDQQLKSPKCNTGYASTSTAVEGLQKNVNKYVQEGLDSGSSVGYTTASAAKTTTVLASSSPDQQLNTHEPSTGYQLASTAKEGLKNCVSKYGLERLDSGCSVSYTTASAAKTTAVLESSSPDQQQNNHKPSTGYQLASTAKEGLKNCVNKYGRERLDSGCSVGYTTATAARTTTILASSLPDQQQNNHQRSTRYSLASTDKEGPEKYVNKYHRVQLGSSCSVGYTTTSAVRNTAIITSSSADQQQSNHERSTGYQLASTATECPENYVNKYHQEGLDSGCSVGYTIASAAKSTEIIASGSADQQQSNHVSSTGYQPASTAKKCPENYLNKYHRERLDSGCSVSCTTASAARNTAIIASSSADQQQSNHERSTGYQPASTANECPENYVNKHHRERLDSACSVGYTTASAVRSTSIIASSSIDQQQSNHERSTGYALASSAKEGPEKHVNKYDRERLDSGCSVGYTTAFTAKDEPALSPSSTQQRYTSTCSPGDMATIVAMEEQGKAAIKNDLTRLDSGCDMAYTTFAVINYIDEVPFYTIDDG